MKFTIKLKIVALGAILSLLVTVSAIIFSSIEYRQHGKRNQQNTINKWLDNMQSDFDDPDYGEDYLITVQNARDYILENYAINPDDPPEGSSFKERKDFYKTNFRQLYAIEDFGLYPMSDEEIDFRKNYSEFIFLLSDAKTATKSISVFAAFITENKTMFYIGDGYSYKKIDREDSYLPGSRYYNFQGQFVRNGSYYDCKYDKITTKAMPIVYKNQTIAYIFVQYDYSEVYADANSLMRTEIIALSIASLVMIVAYALGAHFLLIRNVTKLTKSATEFSNDLEKGEKLEKKDPCVKSHDEIRLLSDSFVTLEEGIIKYIDVIQKETEEKERTNAELNVATSIQLSALPKRAYDDKNVAIRAFIKSAKEVGGDFYDYFYLDDNRLAIVISDVSGKGIPAALFMMKSKELIKSALRSHDNLVDAVKEVNSLLVSNDKESLFVTSFLGVIDFKKNIITYVNAGHEKPYIVTSKEVIKLDGESNFVIGGEEDIDYKQESHTLKKGEFIFLFTDGLNESINSDRKEFSYERIEQTLKENKDLPLDKIIDVMNANLDAFVGKEEPFDDVTMLLVKNSDNSLHLSYDKKDYEIIPKIVDSFNEAFAYLPTECKAAAGIVIDELINNQISYEKREDLKIDLNFKVVEKELHIEISSNGEDFNPFINHQEKYATEFDPDMAEGGYGLSIIKDFAKSWDYQYKNKKAIILIKIDATK